MLKQLVRFVMVGVVSLGTGALLAADAPATFNIGVLDWQVLLAKAPQADAAGKRLEKEFEKPKNDLINKQKEFQSKREKMQRDADTLSSAEKTKREKELVKMEQDLRRLDEELRSDYTARHREEMDNFIKTVKDVVDKLAEEQKYDVVLPQEATLYVADRINITAKVLERLEKSGKK